MVKRRLCICIVVIALILIAIILLKEPVASDDSKFPIKREETIQPLYITETAPVEPEELIKDFHIDWGKAGVFYTVEWVDGLHEQLKSAPEWSVETYEWWIANNIVWELDHLLSAPSGRADETIPDMIAKVIQNEIGGLTDNIAYQNSAAMEKAAVAWCIFNRVDTYSITPMEPENVITAILDCVKPGQFTYRYNTAPSEESSVIAVDVTIRWVLERWGFNSGRVLPAEYKWFTGDLQYHNYFRDKYLGGNTWMWDLVNPYEETP